MKKWCLLTVFGFCVAYAKAQNPVADFSLPSSACLSQNIQIQNLSTNTTRYEWDFCQGDLSLTPSVNSNIYSQGNVTAGVDVVYDGTNWYGFVTSRETNSIKRLDFGKDYNSTPAIVDLGNIGGISPWRPIDIHVVFDNGFWYGFVYGESSNQITRINFSDRLDTSPNQLTSEVIFAGNGNSTSGLDIIQSGSEWIILFTNAYSLNVLKLTTINAIPGVADQILNISIPSANGLGDIKILKDNGMWYAYVPAANSTSFYRLRFGSSLFSVPQIDDFTSYLISGYTPYGIDAGYDAGQFISFICTIEGAIMRIDLGSSLANNPISSYNLGNLTSINSTLKIDLKKVKSTWIATSVSWDAGQVFRINFPNPVCTDMPLILTSQNPQVTYSAAGSKYATLRAFNGLTFDEVSKSVSIAPQTSPDINFLYTGICISNNTDFTSLNQSGDITNYQWVFNDGNTSSSPNPTHIYSTASTYNPSLTVTSSNGCQNFVQDTLQIFNPPQANFNLPTASPFCTNQNYVYTNTSTYDNGSNPTWQWSVDGANVATTPDLNYLFTSSAAQSVALIASIPGCSTQSVQNITTLVDGPLVSFNSPSTGCRSSAIAFINTTTDPVNSFSWDFGDGNSSVQTSPAHSYSSTGTYPIKLSATNANGCQNSSTKNISIYSVPQPDFAIEAPPLSCEKSPSQLDNLTPALVDSNISSWSWQFGDTGNGSSVEKNPTYTYGTSGNYNVSLKATSNFGCSNSIQKAVTVFPSPVAAFTSAPACVNQSTQFTDASSGSISFYKWAVQNSLLSGATANYSFNSSGVFPVTLTVTGSNGCVNQTTKNITVPVMPVVDFSVQAPCTGHPSIFQEVNAGGVDPAIAWNWNFGSGSSTGSPTNFQFSSTGNYNVTMNTTRQSGCVYSISKNMLISAGPMASFTPSVFAGAAPLNVTFNNTSTADSYAWSFGDASQSTSSAVSPSFSYISLGKYKALLTAKNNLGCTDTLSTEINVVIPHIDIAMNNFSLTNDPSSNVSKAVVTILNSGNIPLIDPEVLIDLGGDASIKEKVSGMVWPGKSITQTLGLQIVPQSLQYICAEIDVTDDTDTYNNKQCVTLSSDDVVMMPYPNPSSNQLTLEWVGAAQENVRVTIFKSDGEIAFEQELDDAQAGLGQFTINTSSFASGLYLVQFSGSRTTKTFKIVIAN